MQQKNLIDLIIYVLHSVGVVKKCELSRSTVLKSFTHKQKADNPVFPSCSPLKVFEVTYTCTYKTCILFTKLKWSQELLYNLLMVSALSSALKHKQSVNCLQGNMGVYAVQAEEAFDGRKNKSYKKTQNILSKVFCRPPVVD